MGTSKLIKGEYQMNLKKVIHITIPAYFIPENVLYFIMVRNTCRYVLEHDNTTF